MKIPDVDIIEYLFHASLDIDDSRGEILLHQQINKNNTQ